MEVEGLPAAVTSASTLAEAPAAPFGEASNRRKAPSHEAASR